MVTSESCWGGGGVGGVGQARVLDLGLGRWWRLGRHRVAGRRRLWCWIRSVLGLFCLAGLILFEVHCNHDEDRNTKSSSHVSCLLGFLAPFIGIGDLSSAFSRF